MILVGQDHQSGTAHSNARFPRAGVLFLAGNTLQSLVPSTLTSQVEALLESHRIEDAIDLADQQHRKVYGNIAVDEDQAEELRYVYQRIGFQCFSETLFEDAGKILFKGELDPRLLISYYPALRGSLFTSEDSIDVFTGVADRMPTERSVEEIIAANLVRNYSPHLAPNTRSAPPTAELRKILVMAAQDMLEVFLRKWSTKRKVDGGQPWFQKRWELSYPAVDTVLAKLLAKAEKTAELYSLIQESNAIIIEEVEPVFKETGQYNALSLLYRQTNDDLKLLELWSKVIDGEWLDEDIKNPLADMLNLLTEKKDRALIQQWGLWLTKRDPQQGLKLLTAKEAGKRRDTTENDEELLIQIQATNPAAGTQFLEHLIVQKRTSSRDLHTKYALACVEQILSFLRQDSVLKLWRAKTASYTSSRKESPVSFLSYFSSTTPDSEHKCTRLKTALFLQVSQLYDVRVIYNKLFPHREIMLFELAILQGKLGNHREAITSLVHDLHDNTSAEAYCTLGGEVIPPKVALSILETTPQLQTHQQLWTSPDGMQKGSVLPAKIADEGMKQTLTKILLEVYMADMDLGADRAARLLNSQARSLDASDVITLIPKDWSLTVMSSFLTRSFRTLLHDRHQSQIMKMISAGQNLRVKEETWLVLREEGMVIEEANDDDATDDSENEKFDEKETMGADIQIRPQEHWRPEDVLDVR